MIPGLTISEVCRRLYSRNLLAACDGNVSLRVSEQELLITPSGVNKGFIDEQMLCRLTVSGEIIEGNPSGERAMHLAIYQNVPKAQAVVHAHPPTAIALALAHPEWTELPTHHMSEVILAMGSVVIAPYARPGTSAMGEVLLPFLPQQRNFILSRHGALSWGETLAEAYNGMERMEHISQILMRALTLNSQLKPLPKDELEYLIQLRAKLGPRTL